MISVLDTPQDILTFHAQLRGMVETLVEPLAPQGSPRTLSNNDLQNIGQPVYLLVRSGHIRKLIKDQVVRIYIEGDLLQIDPDESEVTHAIPDDGQAVVCEFTEAAFTTAVLTSPNHMREWIDILDGERRLMEMLCSLYLGEDAQCEVEFIYFEPGDVILQEGGASDAIYELLGGEAVASVGGKGVGLIKKDEIFGEMSLLTGTPCTATVKARTQCFVQKTSTSDFEALVRSRPSLMAQIAAKLAERLVGANKMVAARGTGAKKTIKIRKTRR